MIRNHYQTLGVALSATDEEIKKAYRLYASKYHPDKHQGDKFFEERFQEIQDAYETLSNENKRILYNKELSEQFSPQQKQTSSQQSAPKGDNNDGLKSNLVPIIEKFEASQEEIKSGDKIELRWIVHHADVIKLSDFGDVAPIGTKTIFIKDMNDNDHLIITLGAANTHINKMVTKTLKLKRYREADEKEETEENTSIDNKKVYLFIVLLILAAWLTLYLINLW